MTSSRARIVGVDAARGVALVGMFATHLLPLTAPGGGESLTGRLADGRASALFAVLAGVGVVLSTGGPRPPADGIEHRAAAVGLVVRGLLVGLIGLLLGGLDPPVAVILAYYGLLFVAATPLLRLPSGVLAGAAVLACALTPVLSQVLRTGLPSGPGEQPGLAALAAPGPLLLTLGLTGYYPALTWLTYLLAGMAIGRLDLHRPRIAAALLAGGAALAVAAAVTSAVLVDAAGGRLPSSHRHRYGTTPADNWWWLVTDAPHSGTPLDLAGTTGSALAVVGAMLLLARWCAPLVWLPAAVGAVPLTAYALHVLAVAAHPGDGPDAMTVLLVHLLVVAALGAALRLAHRRGPLEAVTAAASRAARRSVATVGR